MPYGPFTQTILQKIPGNISVYRKYRKWYTQKLPYKSPLPWDAEITTWIKIPNPWDADGRNNSYPGATGYSSPYSSYALSLAYGKLQDELWQSVNLAVALAEGKQTIDMIAKRSAQLLKFAKELKSFQFPQALRTLGFDVIRGKTTKARAKYVVRRNNVEREVRFKRKAKSFADNFLEVHFGIEPLRADIEDGIEMLDQPLWKNNAKRVTVRKSYRETPPLPPSLALYSLGQTRHWSRTGFTLSGSFAIEDNNIGLWKRLGFANPEVVLWNTLPFSFVVDWFVNVEQWLSARTDFQNIAISDASTTYFADIVTTRYLCQLLNGVPKVAAYGQDRSIFVRRTLGIAKPKLVVKPLKGLSVTRGLTAVALLTQFLRKQL